MRKKIAPGSPLLVLLVVLLVAGGLSAQAPVIDVSSRSLDTGLTDEEKRQVHDYIAHWVGIIRTTQKQPEVLQAAEALLSVNGYRKYVRTAYQSFYAADAARQFTAILRERPMPLRHMKEINLSMAMAEMAQPSAQPAFDVMVSHPNEGVRYLGWQSYRRVRTDVLAAGGKPAEKLMASLARAARAEDSAIVSEELFRMLTPPEVVFTPMSEAQLAKVRGELFDLLQRCWFAWCVRVKDGRGDSPDSLRVGLGAVAASLRVLGKDPAVKTAVLQMLMDMIWCTAKRYEDVGGTGTVAEECAGWLGDLEKALNEAAGMTLAPVAEALGKGDMDAKDRAAMVRVAAAEWNGKLEPLGVKRSSKRFAPPPPPATSPTTAPGGGA